jgi:hypothetical protein
VINAQVSLQARHLLTLPVVPPGFWASGKKPPPRFATPGGGSAFRPLTTAARPPRRVALIAAQHQAALGSPPAGGITSCETGAGSEAGFSLLWWIGPNTLLALSHSAKISP